MTPRTGRPKIENPKSIDIKIRVDKETNERLLEYAKTHGITRVEVIRQGLEMVLNKK